MEENTKTMGNSTSYCGDLKRFVERLLLKSPILPTRGTLEKKQIDAFFQEDKLTKEIIAILQGALEGKSLVFLGNEWAQKLGIPIGGSALPVLLRLAEEVVRHYERSEP